MIYSHKQENMVLNHVKPIKNHGCYGDLLKIMARFLPTSGAPGAPGPCTASDVHFSATSAFDRLVVISSAESSETLQVAIKNHGSLDWLKGNSSEFWLTPCVYSMFLFIIFG